PLAVRVPRDQPPPPRVAADSGEAVRVPLLPRRLGRRRARAARAGDRRAQGRGSRGQGSRELSGGERGNIATVRLALVLVLLSATFALAQDPGAKPVTTFYAQDVAPEESGTILG